MPGYVAPGARNIKPRCRKACSRRIGTTTDRGSNSRSFGIRYSATITPKTSVLNSKLTVRIFIRSPFDGCYLEWHLVSNAVAAHARCKPPTLAAIDAYAARDRK